MESIQIDLKFLSDEDTIIPLTRFNQKVREDYASVSPYDENDF